MDKKMLDSFVLILYYTDGLGPCFRLKQHLRNQTTKYQNGPDLRL